MVKISKEDLAKLAIGWGVANFLTKGALERPIQSVTIKAITKAAPLIGRALIRYGPTVALTAARVTPTPLAVAATGALALQNRELIQDAAGNVYEKVAPAAQEYGAGVVERALDPETYMMQREGPTLGGDVLMQPFVERSKKKKTTKFNKAVSKGMSVIKASTSYGKKGTINNAKKAFSVVTRTASAINKGGKVAKSGIKRKLGLVMRKIL